MGLNLNYLVYFEEEIKKTYQLETQKRINCSAGFKF